MLADPGLTQLLPVSSSGVSGIALHFPDCARPSGILRVELEGVESGVVHGAWDLPSEKLRGGWTYFALSRACDNASQSLRLRLRGLEGAAPEPSLGYPIPHRRFAIQSPAAGPQVEYRPLAFRVYAGLPGIRPSGVMAMLSVVAQDRPYRDISFDLPPDLLGRVVDLSVRTEPPSFENVRFLEHEAAIVCHPLLSGTSIACLPEALPGGRQYHHGALQRGSSRRGPRPRGDRGAGAGPAGRSGGPRRCRGARRHPGRHPVQRLAPGDQGCARLGIAAIARRSARSA
ncbi:hypothetical protein KSF81_06450 [Siccirubricoccus sp. G192]|nr:hypothetical protein [Siccirubricoccus sp. G192]